MLVGISGKMGSGKSTVAELFRGWGARVITADEIGWFILEEPEVKRALVKEFGKEILDAEGRVDRKSLGSKAFTSSDRLHALNEIVHPPLLARLRQECESASADTGLVVVDAALIAEWEVEDWFDKVIVLVCPEECKLRRLARSGMDREDAEERLKHQIPDEERIKIGDYVIDNSGTAEELRVRAREVYESIAAAGKDESGEE